MKFIILKYEDIWVLIFSSVIQNIFKKCVEYGDYIIYITSKEIKLRSFQLQHTFYSGEEQGGYMSC